ncbi:endonuclease domain-containing protein [Streptomyces thermolilacinus]|uniref:endonuclease domain-containing protein n=1 Tax=Streptomyces thermolilacinus TaxID=285540 RepID=UPI0009A08C48|nr:endonuclease domain-containing protein [Streptomyces thermolilacinus]
MEEAAAQGVRVVPARPGPVIPGRHVDLRHGTGKVRGVPCFNRNSAIGKLRDDPGVIRRAVAHVEGNSWKPTPVAPGVCRLPS